MDFATEPVLDAFTLPPTRAAARPAAQTNDTGPTFEEHLDAANEAAPETCPAPRSEPASDTPNAEIASAPAIVDSQDPVDPDTALLGGPVVAPPVVTAPVMVQIAMAQPAQTQAQPGEASTGEAAPAAAPQTPAPSAPVMDAAAPAPVAPTQPAKTKDAGTEAKAPTAAAKTEGATQTANAPTQAAQAPIATAQAASVTTPVAQAAPVAVEQLPPAVQLAIAATIAPAQQAAAPTGQRIAKPTAETGDVKQAPDANIAKMAASPAPNANLKTQAAKANVMAVAADEPVAASPSQAGAADTQQFAQTITTTATQASTHAQHVAADTGAQRTGSAATQVGREIIRRFDGGNTSFEIRLDPAELGRVEVRMEVSRDHRVTAVITADSPQALTELARHARELESQLQSAGLQLSDNGLSFDLRQQTNGREAQEASASQPGGSEQAAPEQQVTQTARPIGFERWRGVRVDMMV